MRTQLVRPPDGPPAFPRLLGSDPVPTIRRVSYDGTDAVVIGYTADQWSRLRRKPEGFVTLAGIYVKVMLR
jgi:hypothetical protein